MRLIQTKLNLYLPSDDVVREDRPYNIFRKFPNLVIATLCTTTSSSAISNLKYSIYTFNYSKPDKNSNVDVDYDTVNRSIRVEKIDNQDFTLEFLSCGLDYPINSMSYSYFNYSIHTYDAAVFKISSPELDKKFPGLDIGILCSPSFLMKQLSATRTLDNGRLPLKYYYVAGGLFIDKLRVCFDDMNNIRGNQHLLDYSKKRSEGSFKSGKKLIPGKLYSSTRTECGNYFLYLGEFEKCLTSTKWRSSHVFDWNSAYSSNCYGTNNKAGQNHGGKLILEFSSFDVINFDLKGLDYITAMRTIITVHNRKVDSSPWSGYSIEIVPPETCLRGVELDDFINVDGQFSPETLVESYINENLSNGNYDFPGNNILASLVWDKFKDNEALKDVLIEKFAQSYWRQINNYGMKYENIRENFKTITELDGHLLDKAVNIVSQRTSNP
jgi:hypothetical protein